MVEKKLRNEIIDTALILFDQKGYHGVSINEIVQKVGTSKGGFYHHFSSKEELLFVIHDIFITYALEKVEVATLEHNKPVEKLKALIKEHLKVFHLYKSHLTIFYQESNYLRFEDKQIINQKRKTFKNIIFNVVREGQDKNEFRNDIDINITTMAILGMINWVYKWYEKDGIYTIEKIGSFYEDLIIHSVLTEEELKNQTKNKSAII